jgi:signal peptidase I
VDRSERSRRSSRLGTWAVAGIALRSLGRIPSVHAYYIPSESMMPTLLKNDHILAATGVGGPFARGDVILFRTRSGDTYIQRVAALPGDRIAVSGGTVLLNGKAVPQQPLGIGQTGCLSFPEARPRRLREQFPGEAQAHQIYDCGPSPADVFAEQAVAPDHLFTLGDNRDDSADARVPPEMGGVSQVAIADVVGRAPVYTWARERKFMQPVH